MLSPALFAPCTAGSKTALLNVSKAMRRDTEELTDFCSSILFKFYAVKMIPVDLIQNAIFESRDHGPVVAVVTVDHRTSVICTLTDTIGLCFICCAHCSSMDMRSWKEPSVLGKYEQTPDPSTQDQDVLLQEARTEQSACSCKRFTATFWFSFFASGLDRNPITR